jgi:hypothetical protein
MILVGHSLKNALFTALKLLCNIYVTMESEVNGRTADPEGGRNALAVIGGLIGIIIILLGLFATIYLTRQGILFRSRAQGGSSQAVSLANSYIFASPLRARANGDEKIRITIFALDSQGKGVFGRPVTLGQADSIKEDAVQPTTDDLGRAVFDIASSHAGYFLIEALIEGKVIPQKVGVTFE